jgi:hypothetical protein
VVVAAQVQHAVDDGLAQILCVLGTDHDISQLSRADGRARFVDGEGEHVGGLVACSVAAVEIADALPVDKGDRQMPLAHPGGGEGGEGGLSQLGRSVDEIELDYQPCWRLGGRSAGACFSAYSL